MSVARIQDKGQVTIPTGVRRRAGRSKGDLVQFDVKGGKIVITPKASVAGSTYLGADDEYTAAQRGVVDRGINESLKEYRAGKVAGPFSTAEAFLADLHKESAKLSAKKTKRVGK